VRRIEIYIYNPENIIIVEKGNKKNIPVVKNVFVKRKSKRGQSNVNLDNNSQIVILYI